MYSVYALYMFVPSAASVSGFKCRIYTYIYIYIYIYVCMYVCMCVCDFSETFMVGGIRDLMTIVQDQ